MSTEAFFAKYSERLYSEIYQNLFCECFLLLLVFNLYKIVL